LYLDKFVRGVYFTTPSVVFLWVQSRFAETRFAEMPILTLTLNPNFGETGFGESGFGETGRHRFCACARICTSHSYGFLQKLKCTISPAPDVGSLPNFQDL